MNEFEMFIRKLSTTLPCVLVIVFDHMHVHARVVSKVIQDLGVNLYKFE